MAQGSDTHSDKVLKIVFFLTIGGVALFAAIVHLFVL
jgi:hypothetical protein